MPDYCAGQSDRYQVARNFFEEENVMTKQQVNKVKQQILALNWDANRKRAKARNLVLDVMKLKPNFRFTRADYKAFFKSRNIAPNFPCR
jgi:hypothetical protein